MPGLSVLIKIFRVRQNNIRTQELECFVEYFPHIWQLPGLKNVSSIHHDLEPRRSDLVEKQSSFGYGINGVPDPFRFKPQKKFNREWRRYRG